MDRSRQGWIWIGTVRGVLTERGEEWLRVEGLADGKAHAGADTGAHAALSVPIRASPDGSAVAPLQTRFCAGPY